MSEGRFYYYDDTQCTFVEVRRSRSDAVKRGSIVLVVALIIAGVMYWGLRGIWGSPEMIALKSENEALRAQLEETGSRIDEIRGQLEHFAEVDDELYRTILQAEPISEDVREAGAGGADVYEDFGRFSSDTRNVLKETAENLDRLERQMQIQSASYRDLVEKAEHRMDELRELPAIMPSEGRLVSGYGVRLHPIDRIRKMHYGIDVTTPRGTPVVATADGVVSYTGRRGGYGVTVEVRHTASGYTTRYAHLSKIPSGIRRGKSVERGDLIAYTGNSGRSTAPHLHYEVLDRNRRPVNPIDFFAPGMTPSEFQRLRDEADAAISPLD